MHLRLLCMQMAFLWNSGGYKRCRRGALHHGSIYSYASCRTSNKVLKRSLPIACMEMNRSNFKTPSPSGHFRWPPPASLHLASPSLVWGLYPFHWICAACQAACGACIVRWSALTIILSILRDSQVKFTATPTSFADLSCCSYNHNTHQSFVKPRIPIKRPSINPQSITTLSTIADMSSILATALFASYATAALTTSIWLPGAASVDVSFVASVIALNDDRTTLSIDFADATASNDEYYSEVPPTVIVGGATYAAYEATATDDSDGNAATVVISLGCERANTNAVPTCTISTAGLGSAVSAACASAGTDPLASDLEDMCTTVQTLTLSGDSQYYISKRMYNIDVRH